jgi:iron complex transport system ATP-binding protein
MSDPVPRSSAAAPAPGLVVANLSVDLGGRRVVDDVTFTAPPGAVTVLLGPNGAGKSTILRAAAGLLPHQGQIHLGPGSTSLQAPAANLDRKARARAVAYVPQASALQAPMPVHDVVAQARFAHQGWGLARRLTSGDESAITRALARADVATLVDRPFNQLSHGERRRVLVARALATGAGTLLLDEPTAALDVGHALGLLQVLREVAREGAAVVIVLHQLQEATSIADHAVLLQAGRIAHAGSAAEVIAAGPIRAVYGVDLVPAAQFACRLPGQAQS